MLATSSATRLFVKRAIHQGARTASRGLGSQACAFTPRGVKVRIQKGGCLVWQKADYQRLLVCLDSSLPRKSKNIIPVNGSSRAPLLPYENLVKLVTPTTFLNMWKEPMRV